MICCSKQCAPLAIGSIIAILGLTLILLYHIYITIYITIGSNFQAVILSNHSQINGLWKETPSLSHFSVYVYNWTNSEDAIKSKWKILPSEFKKCGPYVLLEHQVQVNMTWNMNDTVTSQQFKIWQFLPENASKTLDNNITNVNPTVSKNGFSIGGRYTMYMGKDNLKSLGTLQLWNGNNKTGSITCSCDNIKKTVGELLPIVEENKPIFLVASNIFDTLRLHSVPDQYKVLGRVAEKQFTVTDLNVDNNTKYSSRACFIVSYGNFVYEPDSGISAEANTQFQVYYYTEPEPYISIFEHLEPTFRTKSSASQPKNYTFVINLLVSLSSLAIYIGWSLFGFGLVLILLGIYLLLTRNRDSNHDTEHLPLVQDDDNV